MKWYSIDLKKPKLEDKIYKDLNENHTYRRSKILLLGYLGEIPFLGFYIKNEYGMEEWRSYNSNEGILEDTVSPEYCAKLITYPGMKFSDF